MITISAVALGDLAIAPLAFLLFVYEAWLFFRAGGGADHAYTAAICFGAGLYSALMFVHYDAGAADALWLTRVEGASLAMIIHAAVALCGAIASRPLPYPPWMLAVSCCAMMALTLSPWLIPEVLPAQVQWLDHPLWRRPQTALMTATHIYGFGLGIHALYWLARHRSTTRRDGRYFVIGFGIWLVTSLYGFGSSMLGQPLYLSVAEYGFFAFAVAMVARDVGLFMQLLEQREAEALSARTGQRAAEVLSSEVVASIGQGIVAVREDLSVELWNPVMETLTEISASDALGAQLSDVLSLTDDPASLRATLTGAIAGAPARVDRCALQTPSGPVQVELAIAPLKQGDAFTGAIMVVTDRRERERITARMMELDRMAAVGTLAAGIGHEVNNPLSWVLLNLTSAREALAEGPLDDPTLVRELLDECHGGAERIRDIVDGLRAHSRPDERNESVELAAVVQGALTLVGNDLRHRAEVSLEVLDEPVVEANPARLGQVFVNLLINAGQAVEGSLAPQVSIAVRSEGDEAIVEVVDTGSGIEEGALTSIFDPFFTTKPSGEGTGLGLSISRKTVHELGGRLEVETTLGEGSTFRVALPVAARPPMPASVPGPKPVSRAPAAASLRVLLVDDEAPLLRALARTLARRGWQTTSADSVDEALRTLAADRGFDAVVTDLSMPARSGMDLHEEIATRWPELEPRVLFMTGGAFTEDARHFLETHATRVLTKPIEPTAIEARLVELLLVDPG